MNTIKNKRVFIVFLIIVSGLIFNLGIISSYCEEGQIDINTASLEELQQLNGIGPVYAQRIIDERIFESIDDLIRVKGIGDVTLQKIKDQGLACVSNYSEPEEEEENQLPEEEEIPAQNQTDLSQNQTSIPEENNSESNSNDNDEDNEPKEIKININNATLEELQLLDGIGAVYAQRIIDARPFYSLDDLLRVNGIGEVTLQKIKNQGYAYVPVSENKNTEDEKLQTENNKSQLTKISSPSEYQTSEQEQNIIQETITLNTKKNSEKTYNMNLIYYGLISFSLFVIALLLLRKGKYKNEFG